MKHFPALNNLQSVVMPLNKLFFHIVITAGYDFFLPLMKNRYEALLLEHFSLKAKKRQRILNNFKIISSLSDLQFIKR